MVFKNSVVYLHWKKDNKKIVQSGNLGKIESEKHSCDTRYVCIAENINVSNNCWLKSQKEMKKFCRKNHQISNFCEFFFV